MCRKTAWLGLIGWVASGVAHAIPAHYIVFEQPLADADEVEFAGAAKQCFSLADILDRARTFDLADTPPMQIQRASTAGNPGNRVDMLLLGDG